jgi:hypothetical protein
MADVFISYAREDQTYARKLAEGLRQRGFEVWMDDRIDFGDRWWQTIVQAIRASAAFVIVMTPVAIYDAEAGIDNPAAGASRLTTRPAERRVFCRDWIH